MSSDWWKFDKDEADDTPAPARLEFFADVDSLPSELDAHEAAALAAIRAIADYGETHPNTRLSVSATLRKISTVAGSRAQSLGLRTVTVKRR